MKHLSTLLTALLLTLSGSVAISQSVNVVTNINLPVSPFLTQLSQSNKLNVILTNNTQAQSRIKLSATIEGVSPRSFSISLNPNYQPLQPIILAPGQSLRLTNSLIEQSFGNFRESNLVFNNISLSDIKSGSNYKIPEGQYRLCITAYNYDVPGYSNPISVPGTGCTFFNICYKVSAPQLVMPVNSLSVLSSTAVTKIAEGNLVNFSWSQPSATCGLAVTGLTYDLDLFEMLPGQIPTDAVRNPPVYQQRNLMTPSFPFQTNLNQHVLVKGKIYVARIRAINSNITSGIEIENNGYSRPIAFQYGENGTSPTPSPTPSSPTIISTTTTACEGVPKVSNRTSLASSVNLLNEEVKIGGFTMKITEVNLNNNKYSGRGYISWKPLSNTLQLAVEFADLQVNTEKVAFEGIVQTSTTPTKDKWKELQVVNSTTGMVSAISPSTAQEINDYLNNNAATKYISKLAGGTPIDFPIGLDKEISGTKVVLAIMGITFLPLGSNMTVLYNMNIPEANGWLSLAGNKFCIKPDGYSFSKGSLYLPQDKVVDLSGTGENKMQLTFKAATNGAADSTKGTYLNWNKDGIEFVLANAEMSFPRSAIVPEDVNAKVKAGVITAKLKFDFLKWNDWVASVDIPSFQLPDVPDFSIKPSSIFYDHSVFRNASAMSFPEQFAGSKDASFEGLWIKDLQVSLPPDFKTFNSTTTRTSFNAINLILDANCVSTSITAVKPIDIATGNLGGWSFALDKLNILVVSNTFRQGTIDGKLKLPISNNSLEYTGILMNGLRPDADKNEGMYYTLNVKPPTTGYSVDLWQASMVISPSSSIKISRDKFGAGAGVQLNGFLTLDIKKSSGGIALLIPDLEIQRLTMSNRDTVQVSGEKQLQEKFSFNHGTWKFNSPQKQAAGMPFTISKVESIYNFTGISTSSATANIGVKFNVNLNVGYGDRTVVSATTGFRVTGDLSFSASKAPALKMNSVGIDEIRLEGKVGPVEVSGSLVFYKTDGKYGDGVKGKLSATFPLVRIDATAQFGSKNGFNYWYIDALGAIKPPVIVGGFAIAGFGGGAYHNMKMDETKLPTVEQIRANEEPSAAKLTSDIAGETVSGLTFTPSEGTSGISASLIFSMSTGPDAFNAKITLTTQIKNGGISAMNLSGDGFAITNFPSNSTARVKGRISMTYNFEKPQSFTLEGKLLAKLGTVDVTVPLNIYAGAEGWYFKLGDPQGDRISLTLVNEGSPSSAYHAYLGATAYFNTGGGSAFKVILPELPPEIKNNYVRDPLVESLLEEFSNKPGGGFMFGARVDGDFRSRFLIFYASIKMYIGLDMAFKKFTNFNCNGVSAGYEGWYGMGQLYAFLKVSAGVHVDVWFYEGDVSLCSLQIGTVLQAGFPNPMWAMGSVFIEGSVLGDMLSFSTNYQVTIGERCYPTPDPLGDIEIIADYGPRNAGGKKPEIYDIPYATTNIALNSDYHIKIPPTEAKPEGEIRTYRFSISTFKITNNKTGQLVDATSIVTDPSGKYIQLKKGYAFDPKTSYSGQITAIAKQLDRSTGNWLDPYNDKEKRLKPVEEVKTFSFTTGDAPPYIPSDQVEYTMPVDRQRFVMREEVGTGVIKIKQWDRQLFQEKSFFAYFIDKNQDTIIGSFTPNEGLKRIDFALPSALKSKSVYRVEFWTDEKDNSASPFSGAFRDLIKPVGSKVNLSTRTTTYNASLGATKVKMVGTMVQMAKRAPIYTMFFGMSQYNSFQQKVKDLGEVKTSTTGKYINLTTTMGAEKFEQYDVVGFRNASGTLYSPFVSALIKWDEKKENDKFAATNIYANYLKFKGMDIQVDLGSNTKRLLNLTPIFTTSNASEYAKPLTDGEIPWQPKLKSSNQETSLYKYANTAFAPPASFIPELTGSQGLAIGSGGGMSLSFATSKLVWQREKFINEDYMLLKQAAVRILQIINSNKLVLNSASAVKKIREFGNPSFQLSTSNVGGTASATLEAIYDIYKDPTSLALIQRVSTAPYVAYPKGGVSRNVFYQYVTPVKRSAEVIIPFKY